MKLSKSPVFAVVATTSVFVAALAYRRVHVTSAMVTSAAVGSAAPPSDTAVRRQAEAKDVACAAGDTVACVDSARDIHDGRAGSPDYAKAAKNYERACDADDPHGCDGLAMLLAVGRGVPRDPARARTLLRRACRPSYPNACNALGAAYETANGGPKEPAQARELFTMACERGVDVACYNLAEHDKAGRSVVPQGTDLPSLYARAARGFRVACNEGKQRDCTFLAILLEHGDGVAANVGAAIELLDRACDDHIGLACHRRGRMHEGGIGGPTDLGRARALYERACRADEPDGCEAAARLQRP